MPKGIKREGLPEYEPRVINEYKAGNGQTYQTKLCHFDYCDKKMYSRGLCKAHWDQLNRGATPGPIIDPRTVSHPGCAFAGCKNTAKTKLSEVNYCQGHMNQQYAGIELRPLAFYSDEGYSDDRERRVCRDCDEDKPVSEFYDRNKHKGKPCKSTQCKDCYRHDQRYREGAEDEKADGTDPLGWKDNPSAQMAHYEMIKEQKREISRRIRESRNKSA